MEKATKIYSSKDRAIRWCEDELSFRHIKTVSLCRNRIKSQKKQRIKEVLKSDLSMINRSKELWFEAGNYATTVHAHFYSFSQKLTSEVRCFQLPLTSAWEVGVGCGAREGGKEGGFLEKCTEWVTQSGRFPSSSTDMAQIKKINEEFLNINILLKELFTT